MARLLDECGGLASAPWVAVDADKDGSVAEARRSLGLELLLVLLEAESLLPMRM